MEVPSVKLFDDEKLWENFVTVLQEPPERAEYRVWGRENDGDKYSDWSGPQPIKSEKYLFERTIDWPNLIRINADDIS